MKPVMGEPIYGGEMGSYDKAAKVRGACGRRQAACVSLDSKGLGTLPQIFGAELCYALQRTEKSWTAAANL